MCVEWVWCVRRLCVCSSLSRQLLSLSLSLSYAPRLTCLMIVSTKPNMQFSNATFSALFYFVLWFFVRFVLWVSTNLQTRLQLEHKVNKQQETGSVNARRKAAAFLFASCKWKAKGKNKLWKKDNIRQKGSVECREKLRTDTGNDTERAFRQSVSQRKRKVTWFMMYPTKFGYLNSSQDTAYNLPSDSLTGMLI